VSTQGKGSTFGVFWVSSEWVVGGRWLREEFSAHGPQTLPIAPSHQNIMVIRWTRKIRTESSFNPQLLFLTKDKTQQHRPARSLKRGLHLAMPRLNVTSKQKATQAPSESPPLQNWRFQLDLRASQLRAPRNTLGELMRKGTWADHSDGKAHL